jgi:predicted nucleic acid-binding protein
VIDVVVDASVFVSRLVRSDAHHATTVGWFERRIDEGALFVAPAHMPAEVAGAIARRTRNGPLARRVIERLLCVPALRVVTLDRRLGSHAADLAADLQLGGADAVYVALAHRLDLPLMTWDREQRDRATRTIAIETPSA